MNVFQTHREIVDDYDKYIHSFINISDPEIEHQVKRSLSEGRLWPQPLLQFNPDYEKVGSIADIVATGLLHPDLEHVFEGYELYRHQRDAMKLGVDDTDFVVTSGTGSGKSLTYIGTIFNRLLAHPDSEGVVAVIVYPMNALINSQSNEIGTYKDNYERNTGREFPITFGQYTGQEKEERRKTMRDAPPQILLTNYMMLELLLTRVQERPIRDGIFKNLRFLVFDEMHTYRGRQGADVSMLIRRVNSHCEQPVCCIGTSATMVSVGSAHSQREEVAEVASRMFGRQLESEQVVDETLAHSLDAGQTNPSGEELRKAIENGVDITGDEDALREHPVAIWLENNVALDERDGRLSRRLPMRLDQVVEKLHQKSGESLASCQDAVETTLQWVSTVNQRIRTAGSRYTLLPFKLHQFIAQTGSVYTTLDQGEGRFITLEPGIYKHDDKDKPIFPNVFSRISGHPFICTSLIDGRLVPREFRAGAEDETTGTPGYLIVGEEVWDPVHDIEYLPETWVRRRANGVVTPVPKRRDRFPKRVAFDEFGNCFEISEPAEGQSWGWFMPEPLLFDPTGGVFYDDKTNEGTKLTRLGNEGRSTSTTITAFSVLKHLRNSDVSVQDQKLLSFTDNRQDAALQAGHFNDFVQVVRLRAGIWRALKDAPDNTLDYMTLGEAVFNSLALPFLDYANRDSEPPLAAVKARYENTFQEFLLFRALGDLRRSWRIVLPNLEQCGLLRIDYRDLAETAVEEPFWSDLEIVCNLTVTERLELLTAILDYFRLEYALHSEIFLRSHKLKEFDKKFRESLKAPWTLEDEDDLRAPSVLRLDPLHRGERLSNKSMGPTSSLGKYLKYMGGQGGTAPEELKGDRYQDFVLRLMRKLKEADYLVESTARSARGEQVPVFCLRIAAIQWKLGDGITIKADPIKRLAYKEQKPKPNEFFGNLYREDFSGSKRLHSADHTGQLGVDARQDREDRFRAEWHLDEGRKHLNEEKIRRESISALFCSPTMELGVDIGGLSVVHMRNAPPNAANYVQRSGRAGRSGQGALVFTYCSGFSPHDRHYFNDQAALVAGTVLAPRIDLCNRELLLTHLHALAISAVGLPGLESESGQRPSLKRLVTDEEEDATMPLAPNVAEGLKIQPTTFEVIKGTFSHVIADFESKLTSQSNAWYGEDWIGANLSAIVDSLDKSMERWRKMYQSALGLLHRATQPIDSGMLKVGSPEYKRYKRQQDQANHQLNLLRNDQRGFSDLSEFYPYRYLASEGFLPGYNFTRLPLRVYVPTGATTGEYISRPRSIALREFGPRNIIYHSGSKYRVSQLVVQDAESSLTEAKISKKVGYFLSGEQGDLEICPFSGVNLGDTVNSDYVHNLLEMTESRSDETARITCEEEERISRGYDIKSYFHVDGGNFESIRVAEARSSDSHLLNLRFIPAARLISLNRGWRSRREEGFPIGMTSGNWGASAPTGDPDEREESRTVKLWTSNVADALYIEPIEALGLNPDGVVTLQHALKRAIEAVFEVEPREIGVSAMGDVERPNILIFESAEGSLGILSQLVEDPGAFREVVESAERLCRFEDEEYLAPASYDDLLSYYNQRDHQRINRFLIRDALAKLKLAEIEIRTNPAFRDYEEQYQTMLRELDPNSSTERAFIDHLYQSGLRLPDAAQKRVPGIYCQPDFYYEPRIWVFCDGTPHDEPEVRDRDEEQRQLIIARGDEVWAWHYREDLCAKVAQRPDIFTQVR